MNEVAPKWAACIVYYQDFDSLTNLLNSLESQSLKPNEVFIADNNSAVLSCSITGVEPLTKSKANTQLFDKRSESLKAYLLSNGCASVQMSKPIGRKEKLASRTIWKVAVDLVN